MKKTFALLGWLIAAVLLVLSPSTGLTNASDAVAELTQGDTTTTAAAEPPPDYTSAGVDSAPESTSTTTSTQTPLTMPATATAVGETASTRFGTFQVEITVADGVLVDIAVLQEPGDRRSQNINDQAFPVYEEAAIDAQGTDFDVLSGATITWQAYRESLQSALDEVGL